MKKLISLILILTLLSACWNKNTQNPINNTSLNINPKQKVQQAEEELKKAWFTWKKLKDAVYQQKLIYNQIANLTWDAKNDYILQHQVLPEVLKKKEAMKCKDTTDIDLFAKCMVRQNIALQNITKLLPAQTRQSFEKKYYKSFYSYDTRNLLKKTSNPIALKAKEKEIDSVIENWLLTKWMCGKLPEEQTQNYCLNAFKSDGWD